MKLQFALLLAASLVFTARADAHSRSHAHSHSRITRHHRGRVRVRTPRPRSRDELELSPSLLEQLQAHLRDGGYLRGRADGRLTPRTRRALIDFQREYHLRPTGALDRATADALLGRDTIAAYLSSSE